MAKANINLEKNIFFVQDIYILEVLKANKNNALTISQMIFEIEKNFFITFSKTTLYKCCNNLVDNNKIEFIIEVFGKTKNYTKKYLIKK